MTLQQFRKRIDRIDRKVVALLNERAEIALQVGKLKQEQGLPILARGREEAVYASLAALNAGPLENEQINRIYLRIMREMKHLQRRDADAATLRSGKTRGTSAKAGRLARKKTDRLAKR